MIIFGKVKEVATNFIKALIYGKSDVRTAPQSLPYGIDSKPVKDKIAVYCQMENRSKSVMLGFLSKSDKTNPGEMRIYATDQSGAEVFSIMMDNNGYVTFDGVGFNDNLVAYQRLKDEYDKTKEVVDLILGVIKTTPGIQEPGNGSPSAFQAALSTAVGSKITGNISSSKIDKIKTS